jgi:uncharacterized protein YjbI with pentapeptide repeats
MARNRRRRLTGILAGFALAAGMMTAAAAPAFAATCPTVDSSTGAVSPAPSAGVDWAGCNLTGADLNNADLAGADLQGATLTNAALNDADLAGANLVSADDANNAEMDGADFADADLESASLMGSLISTANFQSANLTDVDAWGSHFLASQMQGATIVGVDFDAADLTSADMFGATLESITQDQNTTWTNAICPNGASANYYSDGCLSTVDVSQPSATPTITGGTLGGQDWYRSPVTVTWYWIDSNSLDSNCPAATTSTAGQQGAAVTISATCSDNAGNTSTGSATVKIDLTPPVVTVIGPVNGAVYQYPDYPAFGCSTTDALSGVATDAIAVLTGGRPDGSGYFTLSCENGTDVAGNVAPPVTVRFSALYDFGGFLSPKPGGDLSPADRHITVRFRLVLPDGTALPAATQAGLALNYDVKATLRGPGTKADSSICRWVGHSRYFQCLITRPRHLKTGHRHRYTVTVTENLGNGFVAAPADAASQNPVPVYFS